MKEMLHDEWKGDIALVQKMLIKAGLDETENEGELKLIMRTIIWGRYVELMTVDEIQSRLMLDYNIDISTAKYYRILNKAIKLIEKWQ